MIPGLRLLTLPRSRGSHYARRHGALFLLLALLLPLVASACTPQTSTPAPSQPTLALKDCQAKTSFAPLQPVKAECGTLDVQEDPANPNSRKISLAIVVIRAVSRTPAPDPIFLLAGGPGQGAVDSFLVEMNGLESLHFKHDLVMVDQRGTGSSHPLTCLDEERELPVQGVVLPQERLLAEIDQCRAKIDGDPRFYTTDIAMGDLDQVRAGLGYDQINLLGISYGTRAALSYLRLYPEHTRSLILDGVVPPNWALGASVAPDAQRALDLIFARCQQDKACAERFPKLDQAFSDLLAALKDKPVEVTVPHPVTGAPTRVEMNPQSVGTTVRLMSYSDLTTALIPLAIDRAMQGDFQMLASGYLNVTGSLGSSLSMGMYYSVVCAEDAPLLPDQPPAGNFYLDYSLDDVRAACQHWLSGQPAAAAAEAAAAEAAGLKTDVPVLLISGEADPVTPPANAEQVAKLLPNSLHLVVPGTGHNNMQAGCVPQLMRDFVNAGSPNGIDTACLKDIQPFPFFLSPVGPSS